MSKDETEEEERRKRGGREEEERRKTGGKQEENRVCSDVDLWLRTANVYRMVRD